MLDKVPLMLYINILASVSPCVMCITLTTVGFMQECGMCLTAYVCLTAMCA